MENPAVVVLEPAVLGLVNHLAKSGLPAGRAEVLTKIRRGIDKSWGTTLTKSFNDQHGPGWLIDLSAQFSEEMLYAVARPSGGGTRQIVAVVEADDIEALQRGGRSLPSVEGSYGTEPEQASPGAPQIHGAPPALQAARAEPGADDPVLVLVTAPTKLHPENVIRTTGAGVRAVVERLWSEGLRADQIEIWSNCRKPKVQIAFE